MQIALCFLGRDSLLTPSVLVSEQIPTMPGPGARETTNGRASAAGTIPRCAVAIFMMKLHLMRFPIPFCHKLRHWVLPT